MLPNWREIPSLSSLRAFEATARMGNFSEAARLLNVTHAAIAQQVRRLEADLGVSLVRRTGRYVALTAEGSQFAESLREGFSSIARGVASMREGTRRTSMRVTTTTHIADALILPRMSEFWEQQPDIEVALLPSANYVDVLKEGYDLAIRAGDGDWPGLRSELLCKSRMVAVGTPDLIGAQQSDDLHDLPWIWSKSVDWELGVLRSSGLDPDRANLIDIGSPHLELSAVRRGLGMIVATEIIVREELKTGVLCEVEIPNLPEIGYYSVTPPGPLPPIVVQFSDWLKSIFAN